MVALRWLVLVTGFVLGSCNSTQDVKNGFNQWQFVNQSHEGVFSGNLSEKLLLYNATNDSDISLYSEGDCRENETPKCGHYGNCVAIPSDSHTYRCQCVKGYKKDTRYKCVFDYRQPSDFDIKERLTVAAILLGIIFTIFGLVCVCRTQSCRKLFRRRNDYNDRNRSSSTSSFLEMMSEFRDPPPSYSEVYTVTPQLYHRQKPPSYEEVIRLSEASQWRSAELQVPHEDTSHERNSDAATNRTARDRRQTDKPQQQPADTEAASSLATTDILPEENPIHIIVTRHYQQYSRQGTVNLGFQQEEHSA